MNFFEILLLSFVQGLTEFIPVSSSGHLSLIQYFLKLTDMLAFNIAVHFGTVFAICTFYRKTIKKVIIELAGSLRDQKINSSCYLVYYIIIASIPTAFMGYFLRDFFKSLFEKPHSIVFGFCITACVLWIASFKKQKSNFFELPFSKIQHLTTFKAFAIGCIQGISIIPGLSRSGLTISLGLLLKLPHQLAGFFSFVISIPAILGACILEMKDLNFNSQTWAPLVLGAFLSYIFGLLGLWILFRFMEKNKLSYFSYYLLLVSVFIILFI